MRKTVYKIQYIRFGYWQTVAIAFTMDEAMRSIVQTVPPGSTWRISYKGREKIRGQK